MTVLSISPTGATPRDIARAINQLASGRLNVVAKSAAYTLAEGDDVLLANAASAGFTVSLPKAALYTGKKFIIKKIDSSSNLVILDADGSETIDGSTTQTLTTQWEANQIVSDGTGWFRV